MPWTTSRSTVDMQPVSGARMFAERVTGLLHGRRPSKMPRLPRVRDMTRQPVWDGWLPLGDEPARELAEAASSADRAGISFERAGVS